MTEQEFQSVRNLEVAKLKKWVSENKSSNDFDWLALAEHSALTARIKKNYEWGTIAVSIYEDLYRKTADPLFIVSAMNVREFLIRNIESKRKDPVLDPRIIIDWFVDSVSLSPENVEKLSQEWMNLDQKTRVILKNIKNQLTVVLRLYTNPNVKDLPVEFNSWAQVYDKIP